MCTKDATSHCSFNKSQPRLISIIRILFCLLNHNYIKKQRTDIYFKFSIPFSTCIGDSNRKANGETWGMEICFTSVQEINVKPFTSMKKSRGYKWSKEWCGIFCYILCLLFHKAQHTDQESPALSCWTYLKWPRKCLLHDILRAIWGLKHVGRVQQQQVWGMLNWVLDHFFTQQRQLQATVGGFSQHCFGKALRKLCWLFQSHKHVLNIYIIFSGQSCYF